MEENKRKLWTKREIDYLKSNYSNMFNFELSKILNRSEISIYVKANKLGLKKTTEHKSKCISKRNKMVGRDLTNDLLFKIAQKYKSKTELQKKDPSVYSSLKRKGLLNDACSHMIDKSFSIPQIILFDILSKIYENTDISYNDRTILKPYEVDIYLPKYKIGFEYNGKGWHKNNLNDGKKIKLSYEKGIDIIIIAENHREYENDIKKQLVENIGRLGIDINPNKILSIEVKNPYDLVYDKNKIKEICDSYSSFQDFYKNEQSIYNKIRKLNLLDEYTSHMCCRRKKREINEIINKVNKYIYLIDLIKKDYGTYSYVKKNKLNHLLQNLKRTR